MKRQGKMSAKANRQPGFRIYIEWGKGTIKKISRSIPNRYTPGNHATVINNYWQLPHALLLFRSHRTYQMAQVSESTT